MKSYCCWTVATLCLLGFSTWGQEDCENYTVDRMYINPLGDTTVFVTMTNADPEAFINYPGMRLYLVTDQGDQFIGETPPEQQVFGWVGTFSTEIALTEPWNAHFQMDDPYPTLRIELWENFFSSLVCAHVVNAEGQEQHLFSNTSQDHESCPNGLEGGIWGTSIWGQAQAVEIRIWEAENGTPVGEPLLEATDVLADAPNLMPFCIGLESCLLLEIEPVPPGADSSWINLQGSLEWFDSWASYSLFPDETLWVDISPYGNSNCTSTGLVDEALPQWNIYPNPASEEVFIPNVSHPQTIARIYAADGVLLKSAEVGTHSRLDVSALPVGTYSMLIESPDQWNVHRLVIVR